MTKGLTITVEVDLAYNGDYIRGGGVLEGSGETVDAQGSLAENSSTIPLTLKAKPDDATARWNIGLISIQVEDGSSLTIDAETQDPKAFLFL